MANIRDVVVNITRQTTALSSAGFGMPMILATNATKAYKEYTAIADVTEDYATSTTAYKMANAIFSQSPKVEKLAIAGVSYTSTAIVLATLSTTGGAANSNLTFTAKPTGANGNYVKIVLVKPGSDTATTTAARTGTGTSADPYIVTVTCATLSAAITATANDVIAAIVADTNSSAVLRAEPKTGNDGTGVVAALVSTSLSGGTNGSDTTPLITTLNNLVNSQNDWYYLLLDLNGLNEQLALSNWIATQKKLYFTTTNDVNLVPYFTNDRTVIMIHDDSTVYPSAAWVGYGAATTPGSITWKAKPLTGITEAGYTNSQISNIHDKNANTYISSYKILQTSEAKCASGDYIDIIIGQDFIEATMTQDVSLALYSLPKIPYDNTGISFVTGLVKNALEKAVNNKIIAKDSNGNGIYTVSSITRSQASAGDIADRKLTGISWTATLAGAIHSVTISGTLTY
jgi:hypothetical protein